MFVGVWKSGWPMQNEMTSLPLRTSSFTSARTTKAFSVPSSAVRRLILGMRRCSELKACHFILCETAFVPYHFARAESRETLMLINCVAYQEGKKLPDIKPEEIARCLSQPGCFVWLALKDPGPGELAALQHEFDLHELARSEEHTSELQSPVHLV